MVRPFATTADGHGGTVITEVRQFLACAAELARSLDLAARRLPTTSAMQVMREIEQHLL
jgi:hypothetical protein